MGGERDLLRLSFQPSQPPCPASMYMAMLGRLSCLRAYATPSRYPEAEFLHAVLSEFVTRLGRLSGSMMRAMAVLGYFLKMATMAGTLSATLANVCKELGVLTVNVLGLVGGDVAGSEFAVGRLGRAVASWEVVDDEGSELVAGNVFEVVLYDGDASTRVTVRCISCVLSGMYSGSSHPQESPDVGDLGSARSQSAIRHGRRRGYHLLGVLLVGIDGARSERIPTERDGRRASCLSRTRSDGTLFNGAGSSEGTGNGRSQHGGKETLHCCRL